MIQSKLLEEALIHAASTATDDLAVAFLETSINLKEGQHLVGNRLHDGKDKHAKAVAIYRSRWDDAAAALRANAYDKQQMTEMAKRPVTLRTMPVWFMYPYSAEDIVVNDTWVPRLWGEQLMTTIIEEQARALASQMHPGRS
jgi:hypothetical protein